MQLHRLVLDAAPLTPQILAAAASAVLTTANARSLEPQR